MTRKIVVFGAGGFVGKAITNGLRSGGHSVLDLARNDVNLIDERSSEKIQQMVNDGDIAVLAFARAPARGLEDIFENIMMMQNALKYLKGINLSYVLNISSDAVYSDTKEPLNEHSMMAPISAHGVMHCMRERLVDHTFCDSAGHLRPTLIFGKDDPHNGYGPNSFWRKIIADEDITLFGKGEEMRDHIHISDVVSIAIEMIKCQHLGAINAATGQLRSFHDIANSMVTLRKAKCKVLTSQRHGPMPHDGYRAFDNSAARRLLPNIRFMTIENYLLSEST